MTDPNMLPDHKNDNLPGMWENSDFFGGEADAANLENNQLRCKQGYNAYKQMAYKHYKETRDECALRTLLKPALELLQELGWYIFGHHADHNPIPKLELSKQVDETGDPYFERPIK